MAWTPDQLNIGGQNGSSAAASTITLTTIAAVAAGSWIVLVVGNWDAAIQVSSVADNGPGLTWSIVQHANNSQARVALVRAYAPAGMAAGTVITATYTGASGYRAIGGSAFAGGGSASAVQNATPATGSGTAHAVSPTAGAAGDLVVEVAHLNNAATSNTPDANSIECVDFNVGTSPNSWVLQYRIAPSTGATAVGGTWGASNAWAAAGAAFSDASVPAMQTLRPDADLDTAGWTSGPLHSKVSDQSDATVITATASGGTPAAEQTTTLLPDTLVESSGFASIALASIDEDPDTPDTLWAAAATTSATPIARVGFPTPPGNPTGVQTFKAWVRKQGGTGTPTARIDLYSNGVLRATGTAQNVTSATGQLITQTFDLAATPLSNASGADVEARLVCTASGGGPSVRAAVDLGAINWDVARYLTAATAGSTGTARLSLQAGGEPTTRTAHSLKVRTRKTNSAHTGTLRLRLYEGATARSAEYETAALTTSLADYTLALTDVEAAAIGSYADLELRLQGYAAAGDATVFEAAEVALETPASTTPVSAIVQTLPAITQSAAGTRTVPAFTGASSQTLPALAQTATGTAAGPLFTGTAAQTLPMLAQAAAGATTRPVFTGASAQTLPSLSQVAAGTRTVPTFTGTSAQTLASVAQAAAGTAAPPAFTGAAAQTLAVLAQAATGATVVPAFTGAAAQTLPTITQAASGSPVIPSFTGAAAQDLPALSQSAAGATTVPAFTATAAQTLPALEHAAAGAHVAPVFAGTAGQTLPVVTQSAVGSTVVPSFPAVAAQTLPSPTQSAAGATTPPVGVGQASQTLPALAQTATGGHAPPLFTAVAAQVLPSIVQSAVQTIPPPPFTYTGDDAPVFTYGGTGDRIATYGGDGAGFIYGGDDDPTATYAGEPAFTYGGR